MIVNPDVQFLDCPGKAIPLTAYYAEDVHSVEVVSGGMVDIYRFRVL